MNRKEALKDLIKRLHWGEKPEEVKEKFKEIIGSVDSKEIAEIEEELVKEGMPREEIQRLCDVHLAIFKESLEKEKALPPPGHPVRILMKEHEMLLDLAERLKDIGKAVKSAGSFNAIRDRLGHLNEIARDLKDSESHYVREENVLFPYLEKHGITEPPTIMWMEHDKIRGIKKNFYKIIDSCGDVAFKAFAQQLEEATTALAEMLSNHFYKENNILFPTGLKVLSENEWKDVRKQFDEIGYWRYTPEPFRPETGMAEAPAHEPEGEGMIAMETGTLSKEEVETIFNSLPVDITFVDKADAVCYFSQSKERVFPRTKAVIGRKVQQCHPQKSLHVVNKILEDFRSGRRDAAEFWIDLKGRLIYIRYFAVRNKNGEYLGCLEVTQDITDVKKIKGEKRLL